MDKAKQVKKEKKALGSALRFLRVFNCLKQEQIAERLKIQRTTYTAWEIGKNTPDVFMLYKIAKEYGVSVDDILHLAMLEIQTGNFLLFKSIQ